MLKKDDKSQQVVYYQVCSGSLFVLGRHRFKRSILGWHRDVYDSRDRNAVLVKRAEEDRHGYR
jgi:hypothetical protein